MKNICIYLFTLISISVFSQTKVEYLENNRFDLENSSFSFPQKDFNLIGFGAYHGSQKTETTEIALIKSLTKNGAIKYYLPNKNKLTVLGVDLLVSYKFTAKHLLELLAVKKHSRKSVTDLAKMIQNDTVDYLPFSATYSKKVLEEFVEDYEKNGNEFKNSISDKFSFEHLIKNLKETFVDFDNSTKRERLMFENYTALSAHYQFDKKPQFARFGFFHLEKQREGKNPSFFVQLIENGAIPRDKLITIIGYLTESRVLWGRVLDDNGTYKDYNTEGGYGIGDYEKEYFLGIDKLKKTKISDITLFRLNQKDTPYSDGIPDLMEIVMTDEKSNGELVKGKSTTEFLDYAVLISNSKASVPIEEMDKKRLPDNIDEK